MCGCHGTCPAVDCKGPGATQSAGRCDGNWGTDVYARKYTTPGYDVKSIATFDAGAHRPWWQEHSHVQALLHAVEQTVYTRAGSITCVDTCVADGTKVARPRCDPAALRLLEHAEPGTRSRVGVQTAAQGDTGRGLSQRPPPRLQRCEPRRLCVRTRTT